MYRKKHMREDLGTSNTTLVAYAITLRAVRDLVLDEAGEDSVFYAIWLPRTIADLTEIPNMLEAYLVSKRPVKPVGRYSGDGVYLDIYDPYAPEDEQLQEDD